MFKKIENKIKEIALRIHKQNSKDNNIYEDSKLNSFVEGFLNSNFKISSVKKSPGVKKPTAPFTTSTLQQEASRKLGFSVLRTMSAAQKLYEQGFITYMRTDSVNLSDQAHKEIKSTIENNFGNQYYLKRNFFFLLIIWNLF